jgi:hypothetical protein
MQTPILGSAYVARSVNAADNKLINLFPEAIPEGGKTAGFFSRCPGLRTLSTVGTGPIRGLWQYGGSGYVVSGYELYKLNTDWTSTLIGSVSGTGPVSIADNGTQMFIACNGPSYIYNASTNVFAMITDPDFVGAVTVSYVDGYFVFNEPNSQRVWVTSLLDGTSIDPLEFASTEGAPDNLSSIMVDHREIWMFGVNSIEVWYDAGTVDFPLQRIQGAYNELGCAAPYSVAKLDNALFWLGSDARGKGIVYKTQGYSGVRISTHAIEYAIQNYGVINDAIAYTYQQEGHAFYVLIFPAANKTWVYDVSTQAWHERAGFINGEFTRHRSNCQMAFNDQIVIGDYADGRIYAYDLDVYQDKWLRSWRALPTGQNNLKRTAQHSLQLDCEAGLTLAKVDFTKLLETQNDELLTTQFPMYIEIEDGRITNQPQIMLRWSDDGGHTWSNEHWNSMGSTGETGKRVIWRRLGMTMKLRDRVYEISGTDPVKVSIMGAQLLISGTNA